VALMSPGHALIFGAIQSAGGGMLDQHVDDVAVLAIDVDSAAAVLARGEVAGAARAQLGPMQAAIGGAIDAAAGTAAVISECGAAPLVGRGIENVGALRID